MVCPAVGNGKKRSAEYDLEGDQPLAKKFGHLQLVDSKRPPPRNDHPSKASLIESNERMLLDDTKDTIYIHDLEQEIRDIEAQEQYITFCLPNIKDVASVPKSILTNSSKKNNELVLYREPASLTVPQEHDNVRRAIIESRARARAKQSERSESNQAAASGDATAQPDSVKSNVMSNDSDQDEMDIDI
ncbi:hypothetical protein ASPZODRAFT_133361 [Penicilliopsis zonata CBS 506.65]|uniref:Uncharacterized protein n=1 Tax=Penicilliopsis zonata CBS 506.65 TaxID=1073090 RepID=A0A1L9SGY4_9EURO|nr:hypothetical protein ASPZODRAFT_133361 [Penicilliopsis zonata CBS 506.65]OJJ46324.1 hypothetical protein ASPZODRAFT_133361 [Penicilliopsis zonata CBS 506.65]